MTQLKIYAEVFARLIIILIGFILLTPFYLIYIFGFIGEFYLNNLSAFVANTKKQLTTFEYELTKKAE